MQPHANVPLVQVMRRQTVPLYAHGGCILYGDAEPYYTIIAIISYTQYLNCSVRLFPARNKAASGSAVRIYTVCSYGVGFVAGLGVLSENGAKTKFFGVIFCSYL